MAVCLLLCILIPHYSNLEREQRTELDHRQAAADSLVGWLVGCMYERIKEHFRYHAEEFVKLGLCVVLLF